MGDSTIRLPAIEKTSRCNKYEEKVVHQTRRDGTETLTDSKDNKGRNHGKMKTQKLTLDILTPAQELPLGLAIALARDVIRIERHYKEQKMMEEIRKNRNHYQSLKKRIADENRGILTGFPSDSRTSRSKFSYFAPIKDKEPASRLKAESCLIQQKKNEHFLVNKTKTIEKMRKFGQKHKTLKPVKENSRKNLRSKSGLFYP